MSLLLLCILSGLTLVNITVHSIGLHLLLCLHKNDDGDVNQIYLINLSAVEILGNVFWFFVDILRLVEISGLKSPVIDTVQMYISFLTCTLFLFVYYFTMVLITIDKCLEIFLNLKYPLFCNSANAKYLLACIWVVGGIVCVSLILACKVGGFDYRVPFVLYVYPTFDLSYIAIVVGCYSYIFHKFKTSRTAPPCGSKILRAESRSSQDISSPQVCFNSKFYISFLLVLTFLCLVVIPDLIYMCAIVHSGVVVSPAGVLLILYHISFLSDAWIYIFLQRRVRNLFIKKLNVIKPSCCKFVYKYIPGVKDNEYAPGIRLLSTSTQGGERRHMCYLTIEGKKTSVLSDIISTSS